MNDMYISVDVEASGPAPGKYDMVSLGATVVFDRTKTFYREIRPDPDHVPDPGAMKVNKLDYAALLEHGYSADKAMEEFVLWSMAVTKSHRPTFVSFGTFDWMWIGYYLENHGRGYGTPFGPNTLDLKSYYMGWQGCDWAGTRKKNMPAWHLSGGKHTHNALDDAIEQAIMFEKWLVERGLA